MSEQAFEVISVERADLRRWSIAGRAYLDVNLGDTLDTSEEGASEVTVVGIIAYGKATDLLSKMMTGTLIVEGDSPEPVSVLFARTQRP